MGLSGQAPPPISDQLKRFYEGLVELASCLEGQGYEISDPPTYEGVVDNGLASWDPLGELMSTHDLSPSQLTELTDVSPQPQLYSAPEESAKSRKRILLPVDRDA